MGAYRPSDPRDRAKAIAAVAAVHVALAAIIISGLDVRTIASKVDNLQAFDIMLELPKPEPPPPRRQADRARENQGAAGKKAEPSPIVAPTPVIVVPVTPLVAVAPVVGTGVAPSAGAATSGSGPGAGGSGSGRGGGGSGQGLASGPKLISGAPQVSDYRALGARIEGVRHAVLRLTIAPTGRVAECSVIQSTGQADLDARLCPTLSPRMVWSPARDRVGHPATSWLDYTVRISRL